MIPATGMRRRGCIDDRDRIERHRVQEQPGRAGTSVPVVACARTTSGVHTVDIDARHLRTDEVGFAGVGGERGDRARRPRPAPGGSRWCSARCCRQLAVGCSIGRASTSRCRALSHRWCAGGRLADALVELGELPFDHLRRAQRRLGVVAHPLEVAVEQRERLVGAGADVVVEAREHVGHLGDPVVHLVDEQARSSATSSARRFTSSPRTRSAIPFMLGIRLTVAGARATRLQTPPSIGPRSYPRPPWPRSSTSRASRRGRRPPPSGSPTTLRSMVVRGRRCWWWCCTTRSSTGGWIGVEAFFVLSGYLITSLLMIELDTARPNRPRRVLAAPCPSALAGSVHAPGGRGGVHPLDCRPGGLLRDPSATCGALSPTRRTGCSIYGGGGYWRSSPRRRRCTTSGALPSKSSSTSSTPALAIVLLRRRWRNYALPALAR